MTAVAPKDERTDLDLLSASRSGDKEALAEIYSRYKDRLYHHARALLRDDGAAEDLVNESFLRLIRAGGALPKIGSLGGYLHAAVRRLAIDRLRADRTARQRERVFSDQWIRAGTAPLLPGQVDDINRALSLLPAEQLEVVLLHLHGQMTFQQISDTLRIPVNTALSRYRYALTKLLELLGDKP